MNVMSGAARTLLTLSLLKGVGPKTLRRILATPNANITNELAWPELAPTIRSALGKPGELERVKREAARQETLLRADGAHLYALGDSDYPARLSQTPDGPVILFVKGELKPTQPLAVAVVGTREPTKYGVRAAELITSHLVEQGISIVSGLAKGIDKVAHEVTLANGGHTVAVLAHGLDTLYPAAHQGLADMILAQGGALITEYPYGTKPFGPLFVQRDRTQAGLAQAVLLVQTAMDGGSLHASRAALRYNRMLIVPVPAKGDLENSEPKAQGTHHLVSASAEQLAEFLHTTPDRVQTNLFVLKSKHDYAELAAKLSMS